MTGAHGQHGAPDWMLWAPPLDPPQPGGLPRHLAARIAASWWADDPHLCAALQWEAYAAMLPPEPVVTSVSTGVQSVTYASPGGALGMAMARAAWHRSQAGTLVSVPLALAPPGGELDGALAAALDEAAGWWTVEPQGAVP